MIMFVFLKKNVVMVGKRHIWVFKRYLGRFCVGCSAAGQGWGRLPGGKAAIYLGYLTDPDPVDRVKGGYPV